MAMLADMCEELDMLVNKEGMMITVSASSSEAVIEAIQERLGATA